MPAGTMSKEQAERYVAAFKEYGLPLVGEIVDERLGKMREASKKGTGAIAELFGRDPADEEREKSRRASTKGFTVARMLMAYAAAVGQKGGLPLAVTLAKKHFGEDCIEAKALAAQDAAGGGFLIRD